jgi:hypothetical protein
MPKKLRDISKEEDVMREQFIVDWQISETVCPAASFVSLRMQGRRAGLYRVRAFMPKGILLSHGAISFPVGTRLDVEDVLGIVPDKTKNHALNRARLVANDSSGVRLVW